MEVQIELKSFGVVSVGHDEGCGAAGEARVVDALSSAAHTDCSNFILDNREGVETFASPLRVEGLILYLKL